MSAERLEKCFNVNDLLNGMDTAQDYWRFHYKTSTTVPVGRMKLEKHKTNTSDLQIYMSDDHPEMTS